VTARDYVLAVLSVAALLFYVGTAAVLFLVAA
jgi:hypothetical protein